MCARRIAELVAEVLKQAQEAAARCTDKRLSETLLTHAQAAKNFATQLKIISAVKAATYDDDPTVKQQLVKCAKQLAGAMTKVRKTGCLLSFLSCEILRLINRPSMPPRSASCAQRSERARRTPERPFSL